MKSVSEVFFPFIYLFWHGFSAKFSRVGLVCTHIGMKIIVKKLQLDQGHPDVYWLFLVV